MVGISNLMSSLDYFLKVIYRATFDNRQRAYL